jgi:subtilisin-like proprotein convertase family protein
MRSRKSFWILLCLLCLAGAWLFRHQAGRPAVQKKITARPAAMTVHSASTAPKFLTTVPANAAKAGVASASTNQFAYRLSNTSKSIGELARDEKAILLENALIDLRNPMNFSIPKNLQSQGDPGAYIVQANGRINNAFRAMLAAMGATIVSYIPNDAYLVRAPAGVANGIAAGGFSVVPYEPYYKVQSALLPFDQKSLPGGTVLNLGLFADNSQQTVQQIEKLGGQILTQDRSPFGPMVRVLPPPDWTALATLPGVQLVEPFRKRVHANDLSRATVGVSTDSTNAVNYTNIVELTGNNVTVEVNDSGIDATHPDLTPRVFGAPADLTDLDGHGTHVAGIIAGNGTESTTVTNAQGSVNPGVSGQYRGMAPMAHLFIQNLDNPDAVLQETPALTNALISNNSWVNEGNSTYDLAAASYDAATRDALPAVTGSQPVLFVFAAGNDGNGDDAANPGGGSSDTIQSPATAKDVITVGAIQEFRNITNQVTNADSTVSATWQPETSTSYRVAGFSSRGNVGIGTEGTFGRFKPDVVAPGTFVVSTRSSQWDIGTYFYQSPTNFDVQEFNKIIVQPDSLWPNSFPEISSNTIQATIQVVPNADSPNPFPNLPIFVGLLSSSGYDFSTTNNAVSIPPDGPVNYLNAILNSQSFGVGFNYGVSNATSEPISFNLITDIITTNNPGNYFLVLSNLDQSIGKINPSSTGPGPYYRYESGTSMAAADVSGVLALMQGFFTNQWNMRPSPALMKAMLINGARATGFYNFQAHNSINYEGWGLINLPDSLPPAITTNVSTPSASMFIFDQSPTNALATGDSQTFTVTGTNAQPLRVTLVWTDPPGNPAAAIKLVNDLNLVVTNLNNPANPIIYYGNDIPASSTFNSARSSTNTSPNYDSVNNIENVYLPSGVGTNSITVTGNRVNVNAVTAETNNVVQDYALVISSGNGLITNAITVTAGPIISNPTTDQQITGVTNANGPLLNQFVGANTPLLGTNTLSFNGTVEDLGTNWQVTIGMTNQWHFYVVTNNGATGDVTNAAFVTFFPDTLAIPREGVFADSQANATRPEADIDLYVSTNPALTNLDTNVISAAITNGTVSLGRGGTEFVVDTNSVPGKVYYVGVKSEDQMASEFGFLSVFTAQPFSVVQNGAETVNGLLLPVNIPDGSPAHPGVGLIFALAIYPIDVGSVIVNNTITHQNFGDLIGTLNHNGISAVLNNHDSLGSPPGPYSFIYDDSRANNIIGSRPSDGPGNLNNFRGTQGIGPWILTEVDDSLTQTGSVQQFSLQIQPHQANNIFNTNTVAGPGWFYDFVDVPLGATNLTITVTNLTGSVTPPLELFVKLGALPTTNSFDEMVLITNGSPPGGSISIGPPLTSGTYFFGVYNPGNTPQQFIINASVGLGTVPAQVDFTSSGPVPLLDDAVTSNSIAVTQDKIISSVEVGLRVDHPRVSDLVFHLISPDGTRVLLVENRGGTTTNGMGVTLTASNTVAQPQTSSGGPNASSNVINTGQPSGTLTIQYNFFALPDEMRIIDSSNNIIFDSGLISGSGVFNISYTNAPLTIIMNPGGNSSGPGDLWDYTVDATGPAYEYLVLTEDTNKTTTPIKFAPPPFVPGGSSNLTVSDFETALAGDYIAPTPINDESTWSVTGNQVSVVNDPANAAGGNKFLALANGTITNTLPTVAGKTYTLTFADRGPGIVGWWRGEISANDSIGGNNGILENSAGFGTGEVGNCFNLNGINQYVLVNPSSPANLDLSQGSGFTVEGWINPTALSPLSGSGMVIVEYEKALATGSGNDVGLDFSIGSAGPGSLNANIKDIGQGNHVFNSAAGLVTTGVWQHVALTYNKVSGIADFYLNGALVTQANLTSFTPLMNFTNILIGARTTFNSVANPSSQFAGRMDEISMYKRALSASEIKAIYLTGTAGKYDSTEFSVSASQSLAKAQISVGGGTPVVFFGNNTSWQSQSATFTATQTGTPLVISGLEPGMLLDSFTLSQGSGDLFYLPEQPMDPFVGGNANGLWTLEVQDDRVGATNPAPSLVSWQLRFNFTTPTTPASSIGALTNGVPLTNTIPADSIAYYLVNVPTNADFGTNSLFMTNGPLSLLFNQTTPPTGTNAGDYPLFSASTNDFTILSTNSTPTNFVPGGFYYLGVKNTNSFPVNYDIEVNFHLVLPPPTSPITNYPISGIVFTNIGGTNGILLTWFAPTNYQFLIQWTRSLSPSPVSWTTVPGVTPTLVAVAGTTGTYQWFDDFSLTGGFGTLKFYRLIAYPPGVPVPPLLIISSVQAFPGGGVQLQWDGSTNYIYDVLWTTNLALARSNWNVLSNLTSPTLTYGGGVFTFSDPTGALTGGAAALKFFQVLELP